MMTDPIADMLTRIRNASAIGKDEVVFPFSKMKFNIAKILEQEGYIEKAEKIDKEHGSIKIVIKYDENRQPAMKNIKKVSKPGKRVYINKDNLPSVLNNLGIAIISTSQGILTNKEAQKRGVGGEIICEVY